jgi:uncharacterized alpha-E superfamily protein
MEMENMTRGHGWRFLDIGRRLERALSLTDLMRSSLGAGPSHEAMLQPLLEIADSTMTYRRRHFAEAQLPPVLDLLLADATNTRALVFQLIALADHVAQLPRDKRAPSPTREQRLINHAIESLASADFDVIGQPEGDGTFPVLLALLRSIDEDLRGLSDAITYYYFSHAELRIS